MARLRSFMGIRDGEGGLLVSLIALSFCFGAANNFIEASAFSLFLSEYPAQGRGTQGVITLHSRYLDLAGPIVSALVVRPEDQVTLITAGGMALHAEVASIPEAGRTARGQIVMNVYKGDRLSAVARLRADMQQTDVEGS